MNRRKGITPARRISDRSISAAEFTLADTLLAPLACMG
jgi:hypothetical protein